MECWRGSRTPRPHVMTSVLFRTLGEIERVLALSGGRRRGRRGARSSRLETLLRGQGTDCTRSLVARARTGGLPAPPTPPSSERSPDRGGEESSARHWTDALPLVSPLLLLSALLLAETGVMRWRQDRCGAGAMSEDTREATSLVREAPAMTESERRSLPRVWHATPFAKTSHR